MIRRDKSFISFYSFWPFYFPNCLNRIAWMSCLNCWIYSFFLRFCFLFKLFMLSVIKKTWVPFTLLALNVWYNLEAENLFNIIKNKICRNFKRWIFCMSRHTIIAYLFRFFFIVFITYSRRHNIFQILFQFDLILLTKKIRFFFYL